MLSYPRIESDNIARLRQKDQTAGQDDWIQRISESRNPVDALLPAHRIGQHFARARQKEQVAGQDV